MFQRMGYSICCEGYSIVVEELSFVSKTVTGVLRSEHVAKGVVFFFEGYGGRIWDFAVWFESHSKSQRVLSV